MEKQIEEIGKTMCRSFGTDDCVPCDAHRVCMIHLYAEDVCKAGYRRASDVAEEIFAEIEAIKCIGLLQLNASDCYQVVG